MKIRLIEDKAGFDTIREPWNRLVDRMDLSEPFYSWEWANAWIENGFSDSDEIFIVAIEHGNDLLAVAPLCIQKEGVGPLAGRALRTIAGDHADYGSFYLDPERRHRDLLKKLLTTIFEHRDRWDILHLLNFNTRNPQAYLISDLVQSEFGGACTFGEQILTPYLRFGVDDAKTGRKYLRDLDRRERKLFKEHDVEITLDGAYSDGLWNRLIELHLAKWPESVFRSPSNRAFFEQVVRDLEPKQQTSFSWMTIDGEIAAIDFGFQSDRKRLAYMPAYDPQYRSYGLGAIMLKHMLEHYSQSKEEFDFLRGNEHYKFEWTDCVAANHNLLITNGTARSKAFARFTETKDRYRGVDWLRNLYRSAAGKAAL